MKKVYSLILSSDAGTCPKCKNKNLVKTKLLMIALQKDNGRSGNQILDAIWCDDNATVPDDFQTMFVNGNFCHKCQIAFIDDKLFDAIRLKGIDVGNSNILKSKL